MTTELGDNGHEYIVSVEIGLLISDAKGPELSGESR